MGNSIDLTGKFNQFWSTITGAIPNLSAVLIFVGFFLVILSLGKYFWDRRKGSGGNAKAMGWGVFAGAMIAGPDFLFPRVILPLVDLVANGLIYVIEFLMP